AYLLDDWPMLLVLSKTYRIRLVREPLADYRLHSRNTSRTHPLVLLTDMASILLRERGYCRTHGIELRWFESLLRVVTAIGPERLRAVAANGQGDGWGERTAHVDDVL